MKKKLKHIAVRTVRGLATLTLAWLAGCQLGPTYGHPETSDPSATIRPVFISDFEPIGVQLIGVDGLATKALWDIEKPVRIWPGGRALTVEVRYGNKVQGCPCNAYATIPVDLAENKKYQISAAGIDERTIEIWITNTITGTQLPERFEVRVQSGARNYGMGGMPPPQDRPNYDFTKR